MSIRNKLLFILVGFTVLLLVSFGFHLAFLLPIWRMMEEDSVLYDYEAAMEKAVDAFTIEE